MQQVEASVRKHDALAGHAPAGGPRDKIVASENLAIRACGERVANAAASTATAPIWPTETPAAAFASCAASSTDERAASERVRTEIAVSPAPVTSYTAR